MQTQYLPDRKSRGKLQEKGVRIPGTGSVFTYGCISVMSAPQRSPERERSRKNKGLRRNAQLSVVRFHAQPQYFICHI